MAELNKPEAIGYGEDSNWTQIRIRKSYSRKLKSIGLLRTYEQKNGRIVYTPMNLVFEAAIDEFVAQLIHKDKGDGFTHIMSPDCPCVPRWP